MWDTFPLSFLFQKKHPVNVNMYTPLNPVHKDTHQIDVDSNA